eukprot:TRINITY_DN4059_c0_g3_i3.p2 TRINITY_DN4059_c0_g3~~TRINITY_DN4059_c0_g3_i3.p2  ORF type:complete len:132 (+),score=8.53 TRINITY_DN4059_c0_g3_i3:623-1018(+)
MSTDYLHGHSVLMYVQSRSFQIMTLWNVFLVIQVALVVMDLLSSTAQTVEMTHSMITREGLVYCDSVGMESEQMMSHVIMEIASQVMGVIKAVVLSQDGFAMMEVSQPQMSVAVSLIDQTSVLLLTGSEYL